MIFLVKTVVVCFSVFLRFVCVYGHESQIRYGSLFGFPDDLCVWNGVDHLHYLYLANGTDVDPSAWPILYIITMPGLYQYEFHYVDHMKSWIWKTYYCTSKVLPQFVSKVGLAYENELIWVYGRIMVDISNQTTSYAGWLVIFHLYSKKLND